MADGKIRIETKLDNSKLKADVKELNSMVSRCASGIKNLFKPPSQNELKNQIKSLNQSLKENERFIKDNEKQIQSYQDRLNNLDSEKAISSIQKMIDSANNNIEKGKSKIDEYQRKLDEIDIKKSVIIEEVVQNNRIGMNDTDVVVDKRVETSLSENKNYQKLISQEQELVNKMNEYSSSVRNAENNVNVLNQTLSNTKDTLKTDFSRSINDLSNSNTAAIEKSSQLSSAIEKLKAKVNSTKKSFSETGKKFGSFFSIAKKGSNSAIGSIKKMTLAIFGIRSAYLAARKVASAYLEQNKSLSNQVQGIWNTLANVLGPVIEKIIGAVVKAISYVNALIKAFTGIDLVAKANAKAIDNQSKSTSKAGKAAEKAKRQLAGFDEMQVLSKNDSGSGGGASGGSDLPLFTPESIDISSIKAKLEELLEPMKNAWDKYGKQFTDSFKYALNEIWLLIQSIGKSFEEVWLNGTGEMTCSLILQILTNCNNIIGDFSKGFREAWDNAGLGTSITQHLWDILNNYLERFESITKFVDELVKKIDFTPILQGLNSILSLFDDLTHIEATFVDEFLTNIINGNWSGAGEAISNGLIGAFDTVTEWIANIDWVQLGFNIAQFICDGFLAIGEMLLNVDWAGIIASIFTLICEALLTSNKIVFGIVGGALSSIWESIKKAFTYENMLKWIQGVIKSVEDALEKIGGWFSDTFYEALEIVQNIFSPIGDWFSDRYDDIVNAFSGFGDWCDKTFENAVNCIHDWFDDIGKWFTDRKNDIVTAFKSIPTWFSNTFGGAWTSITSIFSLSNVKKFFSDVLTSIQNTFSKIPDWFSTKFTNAWTAVKKVFSSGGKIFDGIKDGILNGLKSVINALISGINKIIKIPFDGINSALRKIKSVDILGFKPFGFISTFTVPQIPKLAKGAIVNNPTGFIAGEAGKEAVLPLQNNTQWMQDLADFINSQRSDEDGEMTINLHIDGEKLFQWFIKRQRKERLVLNG